ncbi:caspase recruitment domain-containing protein 18-like [Acanthochromis polyacanthus]|uniref:caspase recruitment domain-containing protein 18-like n=1 Tax=Acanthochromis polyacanthus TaxID=80966 RepID=UPI00223401FB|nr:caspase recruitment domain-containing protein 18-like [Acanthochromis polyacanthus]
MAAQQLDCVRKVFVENVIDPVISQLLDDLLQDRVFNRGEKDYIIQKYPVTADKARELVDAVIKKGDVASRKMITRLQERDPELYSKMDESCSQPPQPAAQAKMETE